MMAAATAWEGLAAEMSSAASSYGSVISALTAGPWLGPASTSMTAAAAPYVGWMHTTAASAAQTASQAQAAASAFEAAFAATVPPPVIATNRAQLMALVATNLLGQNTPAIMATEAHYGEMWAQDTAAMYGYAASSAVTSQVTPWTAPLQNTNLGGLVAQHAAVTQATLGAAGTSQTTLPQPLTAVPQVLQSLASPATSTSSGSAGSGLLGGSDPLSTLLSDVSNAVSVTDPMVFGMLVPTSMMGTFSAMAHAGAATPALGRLGAELAAPAMAPLQPIVNGLGGLGSGVNPAVSAAMGQAKMLGPLSVPQSWAAATPLNPAVALPGAGGVAEAAGGPASLYGGVPFGAPTGSNAGPLGVNGVLKLPARTFAMPRPPAAG
ncbi:MAG: PPE family protein, partial [Mycobacterium sp.]|nr:PPE family protein [Mycobacterium sp.]